MRVERVTLEAQKQHNFEACPSVPNRGLRLLMFKFGYIGKFDKGYEAMGYIIIASSVFYIFMRIKGQKTMFGATRASISRLAVVPDSKNNLGDRGPLLPLPCVHDTRIGAQYPIAIIPAAPSRCSRARLNGVNPPVRRVGRLRGGSHTPSLLRALPRRNRRPSANTSEHAAPARRRRAGRRCARILDAHATRVRSHTPARRGAARLGRHVQSKARACRRTRSQERRPRARDAARVEYDAAFADKDGPGEVEAADGEELRKRRRPRAPRSSLAARATTSRHVTESSPYAFTMAGAAAQASRQPRAARTRAAVGPGRRSRGRPRRPLEVRRRPGRARSRRPCPA